LPKSTRLMRETTASFFPMISATSPSITFGPTTDDSPGSRILIVSRFPVVTVEEAKSLAGDIQAPAVRRSATAGARVFNSNKRVTEALTRLPLEGRNGRHHIIGRLHRT
jgi:hypothetical protein